MSRLSTAALLAAIVLATSPGIAPSAHAESRGGLLYSTHCAACHTSKKHWRDKKLAADWGSLKALVRRWQAATFLGWRDDDILAVTRHLNRHFYRFAPTDDPVCAQAALRGKIHGSNGQAG